jgi:ketosteroid isomerase-like protein
MSHPNIEIAQQLYAAFARRDIPAIVQMLSPHVEWGEPAHPFNPAGGTRYGHAGFLEWLKIGREAEEILALTPMKFLTDHNSVGVVGHTKCLANPTGKTYERDFVHLITFRESRVNRFQEFFDTFAAGEAFRPGQAQSSRRGEE